ncbi:proprotein convertase P-domain-containing protein [Vibrio sp. TRT 21S02]|uniref:proprotein convertase P-domain-containing protein n=1 Tax=Vibrio sp. TRT 21S02 TaxID=3418507 RepID=UPI003CEAD1E6
MKKALLAVAVAAGISAPAFSETTNIDVMAVYTKGTAEWFKNKSKDHIAEMQHRFNVGNQILKRSGLDVRVNMVATKEYNYDSLPGRKKSQSEALSDLTPDGYFSNKSAQDPAFKTVEADRKAAGADMVALLRHFDLDNTPQDYDPVRRLFSCGLAWTTFKQPAKQTMFSHSYMSELCGEDTLIHELGHNFGLQHARAQGIDQRAYPDAYGHASQNKFATTMAYGFKFGVHGPSYTFSNPDTLCGPTGDQEPCGVKGEANSVRVINLHAPIIANMFESTGTDTGTPPPTEPKPDGQSEYSISKPIALLDARTTEVPFNVEYNGELNGVFFSINVKHQYIGDLDIKLYSPTDKFLHLKASNGNDSGKVFETNTPINGLTKADINGQWRLVIQDKYADDAGTLNSATLSFK